MHDGWLCNTPVQGNDICWSRKTDRGGMKEERRVVEGGLEKTARAFSTTRLVIIMTQLWTHSDN